MKTILKVLFGLMVLVLMVGCNKDVVEVKKNDMELTTADRNACYISDMKWDDGVKVVTVTGIKEDCPLIEEGVLTIPPPGYFGRTFGKGVINIINAPSPLSHLSVMGTDFSMDHPALWTIKRLPKVKSVGVGVANVLKGAVVDADQYKDIKFLWSHVEAGALDSNFEFRAEIEEYVSCQSRKIEGHFPNQKIDLLEEGMKEFVHICPLSQKEVDDFLKEIEEEVKND